MIDIGKFEQAIIDGPQDPKMKQMLDAFRLITFGYDIIMHHWRSCWMFYISSGIASARLDFEDTPDFGDEDIAWICELVVSRTYRRTGIGSKLLKLCEDLAKLLGAQRCALYADVDTWAAQWYPNKGYINTEKSPDPNYIRYEKTL